MCFRMCFRECVSNLFLVAFVDGGSDEKPRYPKVIENTVDHFRKYNLDAFIVMTLASGMSAYNYVERRMAPLSKALAGILLPHDSFGSHLDSQNRTTDAELEKKSFRKAGKVLAEIWGELVMDGWTSCRSRVCCGQAK